MKPFIIFLQLFLPVVLFSQNKSVFKYKIASTVFDMHKILEEEFGKKMEDKFSMEGGVLGNAPMYISLLGFKDGREGASSEQKMEKTPSISTCFVENGKMILGNAIGFMSGVAVSIEMNTADSTYIPKIVFNSDGVKAGKLKLDDEYIADLEVPFKEVSLEFSSDVDFKNGGTITGKLFGKSMEFYMQKNSPQGYEVVQLDVLSIFKCTLEDIQQEMLQMEMMEEGQEKKH